MLLCVKYSDTTVLYRNSTGMGLYCMNTHVPIKKYDIDLVTPLARIIACKSRPVAVMPLACNSFDLLRAGVLHATVCAPVCYVEKKGFVICHLAI